MGAFQFNFENYDDWLGFVDKHREQITIIFAQVSNKGTKPSSFGGIPLEGEFTTLIATSLSMNFAALVNVKGETGKEVGWGAEVMKELNQRFQGAATVLGSAKYLT